MLCVAVLAVVAAAVHGVIGQRCDNAANVLETLVSSEAAQSIYFTPSSGYGKHCLCSVS